MTDQDAKYSVEVYKFDSVFEAFSKGEAERIKKNVKEEMFGEDIFVRITDLEKLNQKEK